MLDLGKRDPTQQQTHARATIGALPHLVLHDPVKWPARHHQDGVRLRQLAEGPDQVRCVLVGPHEAEVEQHLGIVRETKGAPRLGARHPIGIGIAIMPMRHHEAGKPAQTRKALPRLPAAAVAEAKVGVDPGHVERPEPRFQPRMELVVTAEVVHRPEDPDPA